MWRVMNKEIPKVRCISVILVAKCFEDSFKMFLITAPLDNNSMSRVGLHVYAALIRVLGPPRPCTASRL